MRRLTFSEIEHIRGTPGESLLLFITDRCPVGCAHCSVDSRHDSPTITNFELFDSMIQGICAQPMLKMVGISGGEPFVERRGLTLAVNHLSDARKDIVLYTSGIWASLTTPRWIRSVIGKASCVFLSTDAFHAANIDDERYVRAARTVAEEGVWMVVQVLNVPEMVEKADTLLRQAFGGEYSAHAEIHLIAPRAWGRGTAVFFAPRHQRGASFGPCTILTSPVVRYDGVLSPCCNEGVLIGKGPSRLRVQCTSAGEMTDTLAQFSGDAVLNVMSRIGVGALTQHPRFADLAQQRFGDICHLCWAIQERCCTEEDNSDRLLAALAFLSSMVFLPKNH